MVLWALHTRPTYGESDESTATCYLLLALDYLQCMKNRFDINVLSEKSIAILKESLLVNIAVKGKMNKGEKNEYDITSILYDFRFQ